MSDLDHAQRDGSRLDAIEMLANVALSQQRIRSA